MTMSKMNCCKACDAIRASVIFFFNDTATTEIYTLSLHDALPISTDSCGAQGRAPCRASRAGLHRYRSEEHTSELQSPDHLVCRLLLEKRKNHGIETIADFWEPPSGRAVLCVRLDTEVARRALGPH